MRRIFTLFIAFFVVLMAQAQVAQGPNNADVPENAPKPAPNAGEVNWSNHLASASIDGSFATVTVKRNNTGTVNYSNYLKLTDFDFDIPSTYQITGIQVSITQRYYGTDNLTGTVRLIKDGTIPTTNAKTYVGTYSGTSAGSFATRTYGDNTDLWGSSWTQAEIESAGFGVAVEVQKASNGNNQSLTIDIDAVTITVYYAVPLVLTDPQIFTPTSLTATVAEDLTGDDPNGGTLTANLVAGPDPALGTFEFNANGNFSFTPAPITTFPGGPVTFTYNVSSTVGGTSNTATVILDYPDNANLPVNFISFTAKKVSGGTQLTWDVADEHDVARYEVEKNTGNGFKKIGEVAASKSPSYSFVDAQTSAGTVQYRVRNVDIDGQFKYTNIISFKNGVSSVVLKAFPLPAKNSITVQHTSVNNGRITLSAANGQTIKTLVPQKGSVQTEINLEGLKAGMYLLRFDAGDGKLETIKIIKQ